MNLLDARIMFLALMLLAPSRGWAQVLQSFEDLALRVNLDDELQIEDQSGARATGRLSRLTHDEMAIRTDAGEKRFTSDTVREVAVRGHALRKGALIGTGVFAVLGALAVCAHEGGGDCVFVGALGAAPIGAGVGLAMGALISRMRTIYRAPESRASIHGVTRRQRCSRQPARGSCPSGQSRRSAPGRGRSRESGPPVA